MGRRRLGIVVALVVAACGVPPLEDDDAGELARRPADPAIAVPESDAGADDASIDADADAPDASQTDASDVASEPEPPPDPECAPAECTGGGALTKWVMGRLYCKQEVVTCSYGCVEGDAGAVCAPAPTPPPPPEECALGTAYAAGLPCAFRAGNLCFENLGDACACACPGKACKTTSAKKPRLKIPKGLKLPGAGTSGDDASVNDASVGDASLGDAAVTDGGSTTLFVSCAP